MVDVIHKTCQYEACPKQPNFNLPGKKRGIFCRENVILTHVNAQVLLQNLNHAHVLIALAATDKLAKDGETKWMDVLPPHLLDKMNEVGACVVSWMMVKPFPAFPKCCLFRVQLGTQNDYETNLWECF
jgi:hypothetical protein